MNAVRKTYVDNKKWYYIDLKEFEMKIRQDERERQRERSRRIREKRMEILREKLYLLRQKIIGIIVIVITILLCRSDLFYEPKIGGNDCTFALITIPLGLLLIFSKEIFSNDYNDYD